MSAPGGVRDKCSNAVMELRERLVEMLEPDFGLLDRLLSNDLLTYRQVAQVTSCQFDMWDSFCMLVRYADRSVPCMDIAMEPTVWVKTFCGIFSRDEPV